MDKPEKPKTDRAMLDKPMWVSYRVRLDFITKLCASVPANPDLIEMWLKSREPKTKPPGARSIEEINEEVLSTLDQTEEPRISMLVFQRNPENGNNLVVRASTLKAHLKDCAGVISGFQGRMQGEKSFAVKVKNCVYPDETQYWIPILRPDGSSLREADGTIDKAIHVTDARGRPMNALKRFDWIYPARLDFTLKVLFGVVPIHDLQKLFMYGGTHGYAGERSAGEGKYVFQIEEVSDEKGKVRTEDSGRSDKRKRDAVQQAHERGA